jgi:superfamily I DNA and/or RNA helicase
MHQPSSFRPHKDPRPDIEKALDRAIELSTAKKRYTISDGRLIKEEPRRYRYVFTLASSWDVVIIDEGSMAPPPAVLVAANRARSHLIIVGDSLQLAPVCKLKDPNVAPWQKEQDLVQQWLGRDVFFHGGYTLEEAATGTHHSVLLPYQGRMHSAICDLIRGPVYKNRLKDRDPQRVRPTFGPEPEHAVILYNTGGVVRARAEQPVSGSSHFNRYHAETSVHLAQLVLASMPKEDRKAECIGIVTLYAAHRELLKDLVRGTDLEILSRIGTVHAFQGLEFDALIFDLVESPGLNIAPFLRVPPDKQ